MDETNEQQPESATNEDASTEMSAAPPEFTEDFTRSGHSLSDRMPASLVLIMVLAMIYGFTTYNQGFQMLDPTSETWGAFNTRRVLEEGQAWRFFTAPLLHGNLSHLFNNLVGLFIFGQLVEPWIGTVRMILLFIVTAIWSMLFSLLLPPGASTVGASGINYGEIGCYIGLILFFRYATDRETFKQELKAALIFITLFVIWNFTEMKTINIWGHLGGFFSGMLFALWVWEKEKRKLAPAKIQKADDPLAEIIEEDKTPG